MAVDAAARRQRRGSRRSLPVAFSVPFVAIALSAGCWQSTPLGQPVHLVAAPPPISHVVDLGASLAGTDLLPAISEPSGSVSVPAVASTVTTTLIAHPGVQGGLAGLPRDGRALSAAAERAPPRRAA